MFVVFSRLDLNTETYEGLNNDSKKEGYAREDLFSALRVCLTLSCILSENQA